MMSWMQVIDIGHTAVMVPTAGAIVAWLISGRAWKLASCWCLIFAAGLGLVALSKIAFLGWGLSVPPLGFKALSGHAWRAAAVLPVLFFVLLQGAPDNWRKRGFVFGVVLSIGLGALLIMFRFHTTSEVLASLVLGVAAGRVFVRLFVRLSATLPQPGVNRQAVAMSLLTFFIICSLKPSAINHRLVDVALYFSGRDQPYQWTRDAGSCAARQPGTLHSASKVDLHSPG
jgi:hypothetical protein